MARKRCLADLVVVGAGPAGLSAALVAARHGLTVVVLDEFPAPGGRMLGQFHEEPGAGWWFGRKVAERLLRDLKQYNVTPHCGVSVYDLERSGSEWHVKTVNATYVAPRVLLATGAAELPSPVPGWTLPGVMSIGAAQVMTNVHFVKPGNRGLIIGINVLALAIGRELAVSGVSIAGFVLPPNHPITRHESSPASRIELLANVAHLAPSPLLRLGGRLAKSPKVARLASRFFPKSGIRVWDIPLRVRTAAVEIHGTDEVESVSLVDLDGHGRPIPGSLRKEKVDFVAIAGGLYPLAELAAVAGCPFVFVPELGGHIPLHTEQLRTPLDGLYVAGNITGIESAKVAMAQGRLAGTSICADAGKLGADVEHLIALAVEDVRRTRSESIIQFHPGIAEARRRLYQMSAEAALAPASS